MAPGSRKRTSGASESSIVNEEHSQFKRTKINASRNTAAFVHRDQDRARKIDANGDGYWEISKMRRVTISSFRGKTLVNIREYYEKDGQELPGKKVGFASAILLTIALSCPADCSYRESLCQLINLPP
jgi:hypothetical protein